MKRGARLAVLLAALLVLVGAWYLAETLSDRQQEQIAEEAHEYTDISTGPAEDLTALAWDYFGDAVSLSRKDGEWVNANDGACPIDQTAVEPLAEAVAAARAETVITDVTDFDQYGLADPAFTIVAATREQVNTYDVGSPSSNGAYYVRMNGEDTVYVEGTMLAQTFQISVDGLLALEKTPQDISAVTGLAVESGAGVYELRLLAEPEDVWYTGADPWFLMDENSRPVRPLDTEQTAALYSLATDIQLTDCEDWDARDLSAYGLDEPQGTVLVGYRADDGSEESFTLEFGAYDGGDVYVRLGGSKMVYRVAGTVLDGLMYPDFDAMEPLKPCALDWDRLESMTLEMDGDSHEVVRSVSTPTGDEEPEDIYTLGDRSLDGTQVAAWLRQVGEMIADSRTGLTEGRSDLFSMTFRQDNEAWPEVTVRFMAYDSVHYLCAVNEQEYYLVSRTEADSVKEKALEFLTELPE